MVEKENRCSEVYSDTVNVKEKLRMSSLAKENWFKKHDISIIVYAVLLLSEIASNYILWILAILYLGYQIIRHEGKLVLKKFWGENILLIITLIGIAMGLINIIAGDVRVWPYARDIIHITSIALICFCFRNMAEKYSFNLKTVYNTILFFCGTYSLVVTILALPKYIMAASNFYEFVFASTRISESVLALGLYLTFFRPNVIGKVYIGKYIDRVLGISIIVAAMLSFSRTMILLFVCLCSIGLVRHIKQIAKIFLVVFVGILILTRIFPEIVESYEEKIIHSFEEVSSLQSVWDDVSIVQNWRGYEVYCAKREFNSYTLLEQILGKGFGATVDAGDYAHLVTSEDSLPYLHNGYYTTLIKGGILGIGLVILYWCSMIYGIKKKKISKYEKDLSFGIVIGMALSMIFIHGVFWGGNEEIFYLFLVWVNAESNYKGKNLLPGGEEA